MIDKTIASIKEYNLHNLNQLNPFMIQHKRKTGRITIDDAYRQNIVEYIQQYITELYISQYLHSSIHVHRKISLAQRGIKYQMGS